VVASICLGQQLSLNRVMFVGLRKNPARGLLSIASTPHFRRPPSIVSRAYSTTPLTKTWSILTNGMSFSWGTTRWPTIFERCSRRI